MPAEMEYRVVWTEDVDAATGRERARHDTMSEAEGHRMVERLRALDWTTSARVESREVGPWSEVPTSRAKEADDVQ